MPYINKDRAEKMMEDSEFPQNAGELNFYLSCVIAAYLEDKTPNYQTFCEVAGVLKTMYREYERRILDPYEALKQTTGADPYQSFLLKLFKSNDDNN